LKFSQVVLETFKQQPTI